MTLAAGDRHLFSQFIFSDQPGIRVFRHLIFWALFLTINLIPGPPIGHRFEGSYVLFYSMGVPFYYLTYYLADKLLLSSKTDAGFVSFPILVLLAAHLTLTLITALQIHFPYFQQPTPSQIALYSLSAQSHVTGFFQVLEYVFSALSLVFALMPAFVFKMVKEVYLYQKTTSLSQTAELRQQLDDIQNDPGPRFTLSVLESFAHRIPDGPESAKAILTSTAAVIDYSLNESEQEFLPLKTELNAVEKLLHVQTVHFSHKFSSSFNMQGEILANHKLPSMILFGLVQGGLTHTIESSSYKTSLAVDVLIENALLHFTLTQFISKTDLNEDEIKAQWRGSIESLTRYTDVYFLKGFKTRLEQQGKHITLSVTLPIL